MYIKKKIKEQIDKINNFADNHINSKEFYEFIENQKVYIGIKNKNKCTCTNCKTEFETKEKINNIINCPECNKKILIKRTTYYSSKKYLMYLIKYEDKYLIRNYELLTIFSNNNTNFVLTEYGRQEIDKNGVLGLKIIINNMRKNTSGYWYINYCEKTKNWKPEYYITCYGKVFIDNGTIETNYYNIKDLFDNAKLNVCDILKGINEENYILEMLTKAKLYNLATEYYEFKKGKFEDTFGVDKSYLEFMVENNITYDQLKLLQKLKIKDYELIKYFDGIYRLDNLLKYCKPYDLMKYKIKSKDRYMYEDYLDMAIKQKMNIKDKAILYPKNLKEEHDKLQNEIEIKKNKTITNKIKKRCKLLSKNCSMDSIFCIYPAHSYDELIDESSQQNNCVKTYAERYANGECDIYFMRLVEDIEHSLVTVEVRNNKVVQKRTKNNQQTTRRQDMFLNKWEKKLLNNC